MSYPGFYIPTFLVSKLVHVPEYADSTVRKLATVKAERAYIFLPFNFTTELNSIVHNNGKFSTEY